MLFLYNLVLIFLIIISSPIFIYKMIVDKRYRTGLSERFGFLSNTLKATLDGNRPIWFHAASVGEVNASVMLLEKIRERWPDKKLLVSTFTPSGNRAAREKLLEVISQESGVRRIADEVIFLPLDLPFVVGRVLKMVNPSMLILMETELWPNLITKAGRMGIPVIMVNGRISDMSYGKYWFISPLLKKVFKSVTLFFMQSEGDAQRIITLGAEPSKVSVTGNIKFDIRLPINEIPFMNDWNGPVFVAGSTHRGEEAQILDIYKDLQGRYGSMKLILAPRHLERIREVREILAEEGLQYVRRSEVSDIIGSSILLLDTLGELASFYKYGNIVFIGGSLVPVGGHNLLEPAILGKPVLFGPYMENFRDIAQILVDSGGGVRVNNLAELKDRVNTLLSDESSCTSMGEKARQAVLQNRGAVERTLDGISGIVDG